MTEKEWQASTDRNALLGHLAKHCGVTRSRQGRRKLRLFGCACVRRVWRRLTDQRSRAAVEVAERYADGLASAGELKQVAGAAKEAADAAAAATGSDTPQTPAGARRYAAFASWVVALPSAWSAASAAESVRIALWFTAPGEGKAQAALVRDIFGNPFRPHPALDPRWLTWESGAVARLARSLYGANAFAKLPALAALLKRAGCKEAALLRHLRHKGSHARGCWVVDALTGRA
jgi:hypothetical protein